MAGESDRKDVKYTGLGTQESSDLRTWHLQTQDIVSSPYSKKKQVFATLCATLGCLLNGSVIGYTSPAIPSLVNNGTNIWGGDAELDMQQASWITGACFYLKEKNDAAVVNSTDVTSVGTYNSVLGWLPLVSVIGFLFLGNIGYGTLIWVVTAELLPPRVRAMANSFIICFAFITGFIVAKTFVDLIQSDLHESGTFWLYGGICFVGGVFTLIFVPETRNKSIEEIQDYFRAKKPLKSDLSETGHPLESVT